ncbi:MAG TPA: 4-carboxy-4-hydroxy-2-oxoadipate aldolase/oxaloacetate decarboxylase [Candidatus Dormibacteraeota bacterium]
MSARPTVVRTHQRVEPDVVAALGAGGVATVSEAQGRTGLLLPRVRPIYPGAAVAGTAITVLCHPGDNLMLHLAVEFCRAGDVLVVAMTSENEDGLLGELLATSLRAHGVIAVVMDCGVRDVTQLREMGFPVWSRAVSAQGTSKSVAGSVNVPVVCAGQAVHPGDAIVADDDGVVCVPRQTAAEVAARVAERVTSEDAMRQRLAGGELGADVYGLRELADRLGIEYMGDPPPA